eukprot:COSAG02_NODE_3035_length_7502_cov_6.521680_8_plen_120_part_00
MLLLGVVIHPLDAMIAVVPHTHQLVVVNSSNILKQITFKVYDTLKMYFVVTLLCHQSSVSQLAQQIKHAIIVPEFRWYLSDNLNSEGNDAEEKNSEARIRDAVFSDDKSESTKSTKSTV